MLFAVGFAQNTIRSYQGTVLMIGRVAVRAALSALKPWASVTVRARSEKRTSPNAVERSGLLLSLFILGGDGLDRPIESQIQILTSFHLTTLFTPLDALSLN